LIEGSARAAEDLRDRLGALAFDLPQPLGDIEDAAVGGLLRKLEVALRVIALGLGLALVLFRAPALRHGLAAVHLRPAR
jgi:hypothetical protein